MSEFFLWFCERGSCQKAAHQPKTLPGPQKQAVASDHLGPQPCKKSAQPLLPDNPVKVEPERLKLSPKGPATLSLKEPLAGNGPAEPRMGLNAVWKRVCCGEESEVGRVRRLEGDAIGKSNHSLGCVPKGFGGRAPQPPSFNDKQLVRMPNALRGSEPGGPLLAPHSKAKGDHQLGGPTRVPPGALKLGIVGSKRSKKMPRQAFSIKGRGAQHLCPTESW
ncbi:uncharacterized protein LOC134412285 [Elgaria multicarinata webbii]|uniref:uncharacterized protein LOC134412285 n=1 Tax=Elgaria multicarinata webbii TaxID=159646 RepID=UPI002FCD2129